jgi:hypothetical protein
LLLNLAQQGFHVPILEYSIPVIMDVINFAAEIQPSHKNTESAKPVSLSDAVRTLKKRF